MMDSTQYQGVGRKTEKLKHSNVVGTPFLVYSLLPLIPFGDD